MDEGYKTVDDNKTDKRKTYRKEWMKRWRANNPEKAKKIQENYWKKRLEIENYGKESENNESVQGSC